MSSRCVHEEVRLASGDVVLYKGAGVSPCLMKAGVFVRVDDRLSGRSRFLAVGCPSWPLPNDVWAERQEVVQVPFDKLVRSLIWSRTPAGIRVIT